MKQLSGYGNVNTQTMHPTPSHPQKQAGRQAKQSSDSTATLGLTVKLGSHLSHSLSTPHHNLPPHCSVHSLACTHARTDTAVNESTATTTTTTAQVTPLWRGLSSLKRRWIACARSFLVCCSPLLSYHLAANTPKSSLKCFWFLSLCPLSLSVSARPALPLARGVVTPFCSIDF